MTDLWKTSEDGKKLSREFTFKNFAEAMAFANKIAEIAEEMNHHPDLFVSWGKVIVELSTHELGGVSEKDLILATRIDTL